MSWKFVLLWTDLMVYALVMLSCIYFTFCAQNEQMWAPWRNVLSNPKAMVAATIILSYIAIGLIDSIHFRRPLESINNQNQQHYSVEVFSLLDWLFSDITKTIEKTYSSPFSLHSYVKEMRINQTGDIIRDYPRLKIINNQIKNESDKVNDIAAIIMVSSVTALASIALVFSIILLISSRYIPQKTLKDRMRVSVQMIFQSVSFRAFIVTLSIIVFLGFISFTLGHHYHVLGTDKVGEDVFFHAIKSIRVGLIIGTVTTIIMLPFALLFGMMAGYFGGWIDDIIQYIYTTMSSIPSVLLIAASVLMLQIMMSKHPEYFGGIAYRADARLFALCVILGLSKWTSLCRLLRGETLKLRHMEYVSAARMMGVGHISILFKHILPNVMHIILIAIALDFSSLVLAEAVLSYVGIGVDPATQSWGNMINQARLELARTPIVWWSLSSAFAFMFILVLSANVLSDAIRDAFDPRFKPLR